MRRLAFSALVLLSLTAREARAQDATELVSIASLSYPGDLYTPFMPPPGQGTPATALGILRLPPGEGRVPAVVLTHGCSGLTDAEHYWARTLRDAGFATLQVNSFAGRGLASLCRGSRPSTSPA